MFLLKEISGVFCDALVCQSENKSNLLFLSLIGSDSSLQELAGRLSLPSGSNYALDKITIVHKDKKEVQYNAKLLSEKQGQRLPESAAFSGVHVFWSNKQLFPQHAAEGEAYIMFSPDEESVDIERKVWNAVKRVSRLPLLDEWRNTLVQEFTNRKWISSLTCLGNIKAVHVSLPNELIDVVSDLVKTEVLHLNTH